jgi:putative ABC transport system permease protein
MGFALRMAMREIARQAGRLSLIALCLGVGFAAFFATYGFSGRVLGGLRAESRSLLGGDLSLSSRSALSEDALSAARSLPGVQGSVQVWDFPSMASTGEAATAASKLVEVRAVERGYPLAGRLDTSPQRDPGKEPSGVLVDRGLAEAWGLAPAPAGLSPEDLLAQRRGLRLGSGIVPIDGIVGADDSRQAAAFALGPRVYLGRARAESLGLLGARSRLSSRLLLALEPRADATAAAEALRARLPKAARVRVQTHEEAASALARPIRNLNRFVQQLGLFTLLLSSLGAWAILTAYLESRAREAAILRCLGASPLAPAATYALVTALLLAVALAAGAAGGLLAAGLLPSLLGDLIPPAIRQGPAALPPLAETLAAVALLAVVTLPSLARLADAAPLDLLRDTSAPAGRKSLARLCGLLAAGIAAVLVIRNAPSWKVGVVTALGMALLFLALFGASRLLLRIYRRSAASLPLPLKLALGQLSARPALSALMMSVIGFAVFLVLSTQFIKDDLIAPLAAQRGAGRRPNLFFIDVQPDQIRPLKALLTARAGREPLASPMVRARLASVAGKPVLEESPHPAGREESPGEHLRTREQNLTWRERLSDSESVTEGHFWNVPGEPHPEISLEEGFARSIGAKLGDELAFDVQGLEIKGRVTSLRKVQWQSFQPNFFIVMHPSLLEGAPAVWVVAAELDDPRSRAELQAEAAKAFPNLTAVDIGEVVARIGRVLDLVALVTRALGGLMLASALLVLAASLLAGRLGRQRDLALLRTLGARHGTLLQSLAWEFLLLGGSSAFGAGTLAWVLAQAYSSRVLELETHPSPLAAGVLLLAVASLTAVVGLSGSLRALRAKPMEVLRAE